MHINRILLRLVLLCFSIGTKTHAQFGPNVDTNYYPNSNNNYGPNSYNGYWSSNGNGYGYGYYPESNCLYNYVPPYMVSRLDPGLSSILNNLTPMDLQALLNTHYAPDQPFLGQLQAQNPQLYKQLLNAYVGLDPNVQQSVKSLFAAVYESIQKFVNSLNGQGAQSMPIFNQNFPNFANFLRGPGMNALARQPNPFMLPNAASSAPLSSAVGQLPNVPLPNLINPLAPNFQPQSQQPSSSMGEVAALVNGILNTVTSGIGMGTGKK